MATAIIKHTYPEGGEVCFQMSVPDSFPDAVDEARASVARLYHDWLNDEAPVELVEGDEL